MTHSVVLFSGGIDSCAILYDLLNNKQEVATINFHYGQKNIANELECIENISHELSSHRKKITREYIQLPREIFKSALTNIYEPVYNHDTNVPFRNGVFISIAAAYAESIGASKVYIGTHTRGQEYTDTPHYDGTFEFSEVFAKAVSIGTNHKVAVITPFAYVEKRDILEFARNVGVPFDLTWSCYNNGVRHCGECRACHERKKGFTDLGMQDPTEYAKT